MLWKVVTQEGDVSLNEFQLLNILSAKVISDDREDHRVLAQALVERLQSTEVLTNISLVQLATMAFEVGYFYRIFKEKNSTSIEQAEVSNGERDIS